MPLLESLRSTRALVAVLAFVLGFGTIPHRLCERDAGKYFRGDLQAVDALGATVARWTEHDLAPSTFATGSARYDGEWLFGTHMMAAMGFGQVALASPPGPRREENIARMERCLAALLDAPSRRFDREAWGSDALETLRPGDGDRGHAAYLGYAGLALGVHRLLVPSSRFAALHERLVAALERRIDRSPTGLLETYPGEVYPVDNASALGAIALFARARDEAPPRALTRGLDSLRRLGIDPRTGLLVQAVDATTGAPRDEARGSGTALAAYFLAYADVATSATLYRAVRNDLYRTVVGFGAVLEYAPECPEPDAASYGHALPCGEKRGDIDSGPIALGFGVSATGFALGASRVHEDADAFASLYATAHLFGAPFDDDRGTRSFATGGPLGDAILFAMVTAPRGGVGLGRAA